MPSTLGNGAIAAELERIADLLERRRANPYRVRAYRRAARSIERHARSIADMLRAGEPLTDLPAVGTELAKMATEISRTGGARLVEELAQGLPESRPRPRPRAETLRLTEAMREVPPLVRFLSEEPAALRVEAAGDYRRQLERIDRIVLVAATRHPEPVLARFATHAGLEDLEVVGERARARLRGAVPVELRVVDPGGFGTELLDATGSERHARAVRAAAPHPEASEEAVYEAAGLPWIPPELREDGSEIALARDGRLPRLVAAGAVRGDLQMHTDWSDGRATLARMVAGCRERGYEYLAVTDHSGSLTIAHGLDAARLEEQWLAIDEVRAGGPGIVVLRSMEVDILPDGSLDLDAEHLAGLDCVLAAVHVQQRLPRAAQTRRILRALEDEHVDILGHPTGKRGRRPSYDVDLDEVLRACAALDVAVELDCSPDRSDLSAENVRRALDLGCTIVIDTDAHSVGELDNMGYGVGQARRAGAEPGRVLNCRRWPELRRWLMRRGRRQHLAALRPA